MYASVPAEPPENSTDVILMTIHKSAIGLGIPLSRPPDILTIGRRPRLLRVRRMDDGTQDREDRGLNSRTSRKWEADFDHTQSVNDAHTLRQEDSRSYQSSSVAPTTHGIGFTSVCKADAV